MYSSFSIKDFPKSEKPRERIFEKGTEALTDLELMAVLLSSGSGQSSVFDLSKTLLNKSHGLRGLSKLTPNQLLQIKGIGIGKASRISAAFEIARRIISISTELKKSVLTTKDLYEIVKPHLLHKTNERFMVITLDSRKRVINTSEISRGTVNQTLVHPREVFKEAVINNASYIAVAHNHPSGESSPSIDDITITKRLIEGARIMGIPIIDHVIISDSGFESVMDSIRFDSF